MKNLFRTHLQNQQLEFSIYQYLQPLLKVGANTCLRSKSSAQPLSDFIFFRRCMRRKTTKMTSKTFPILTPRQNLQFTIVRDRIGSYINIWWELQDDAFFRCHAAPQWWGEHLDICKLWLWHYFLRWSSYKNQTDQPITEKLPHTMKMRSASKLTINITVQLTRRTPLLSFWAGTVFGTRIQQPLYHSTIFFLGLPFPISILKQQLTKLEPTYARILFAFVLQPCTSTVQFFKEITHRPDEWRNQLPRLISWVVFGSPELEMEFYCLWWTAVVFECSGLF